MKSYSLKKIAVLVFALGIISISFTSCNRGYGCPYEMKAAAKIVLPIIKK